MTRHMPTITVEDEHTFRIHAPHANLVDGGLSPDALALGDERVVIGWIERRTAADHPTDTYFMPSTDECGWEVYQAPARNDAEYFPDPDEDGPVGTLEKRPAHEQLETLRAGVRAALAYAQATSE